MPNYQLSKIYKIVNDITDDIYVGSCVKTLSARLAHHRGKSKIYPERRLYEFVHLHGGWQHFRIILIENYPCNSKEELLAREDWWRRELNASLNSCICTSGVPYVPNPAVREAKFKVFMCGCGSVLTRGSEREHLRTVKHNNYIAQLNDP